MKAAIYLRISKDRAGEGLGVERQREACTALLVSLGWALAGIYEDNDVSAYSGKVRTAYRQMLADIESGKVGAVVAWHTDRLHRSPVELEEYVSLSDKHSVPTHTVEGGPLDLSTPSGRAVARTLGAWARYESEHKAARIKAKHAQLRQSGAMVGCPAFGWQTTPEGRLSGSLDEAEAALIREAADAFLAGHKGLHTIAREWNAQGLVTRRGGAWTHSNLRLLLVSPRIAGYRVHKREIVRDEDGQPVMGQWSPILTEGVWRRVCAKVEGRRTGRAGAVKFLLGGIARCSCGGVLYGRTMTAQANTYSCASCRSAIRQSDVDEAALRGVAKHLLTASGTDGGASAHDDALDLREADLRASRARLVDALADGVLTKADVAPRLATIEAGLKEVEQQRQQSEARSVENEAISRIRLDLFLGTTVDIDDAVTARRQIADAVRAMPLERQRTLIRGTVTVTTRPGRGKNRIEVVGLVEEEQVPA